MFIPIQHLSSTTSRHLGVQNQPIQFHSRHLGKPLHLTTAEKSACPKGGWSNWEICYKSAFFQGNIEKSVSLWGKYPKNLEMHLRMYDVNHVTMYISNCMTSGCQDVLHKGSINFVCFPFFSLLNYASVVESLHNPTSNNNNLVKWGISISTIINSFVKSHHWQRQTCAHSYPQAFCVHDIYSDWYLLNSFEYPRAPLAVYVGTSPFVQSMDGPDDGTRRWNFMRKTGWPISW